VRLPAPHPRPRRRSAFDPAYVGRLSGLAVGPSGCGASSWTWASSSTAGGSGRRLGGATWRARPISSRRWPGSPAMALCPPSPFPGAQSGRRRPHPAPSAHPHRATGPGGGRLSEAVTWSFIARATAALFGGGDARLVLENPIAADLDTMRPSIFRASSRRSVATSGAASSTAPCSRSVRCSPATIRPISAPS